MAFDVRRAQEGYEVQGYSSNVHKLIVQTAQAWFRDASLNNRVFLVRDIACLFVPWEQRTNPETYKMLRFMHVVDWDKWNECIALWLNIMHLYDV